MLDTFDGIEDQEQARPKGPIWTLELDPDAKGYDEKRVLEWLNTELEHLISANRERFQEVKRNRELFKGLQYERIHGRDATRDMRESGSDTKKSFQKVVANHIFDLTQNHVSRLVKYKPAVAIDPTHDEHEDKIAMKGNKLLLDNLWYALNYEEHIEREIARYAKVDGESYLYIYWDPERGELHPSWKKAVKDAEGTDSEVKLPLLDADQNQVKDADGNPMFITEEVRVGDMAYDIKTTFQVLLQKKERYKDVQFCFIREKIDIEEAKIRYPELAGKIKDAKVFDYETIGLKESDHEVDIWHFYHAKFKGLPEGAYITFCSSAIGSSKPYPYSHKDKAEGQLALPIERFTDVDVPDDLHGWSWITFTKGLISTYNNITNAIRLNQSRYAQPKWVVPYGACEVEQLVNDTQVVVRFKGPVPPHLQQMQPTPPELFNFREQLKEEFTQLAGLSTVSRGEAPPGIKAGVALQFLSEQDTERSNESVVKFAAFRKGVAIKTLSGCADNYQDDDERFVSIFGKHSEVVGRQEFKNAWLGRPKSVRIQDASALPQSKAARTQYILDMQQQFPNQIAPEQALEMLDWGGSQKFSDISTVSIRAADAENELLLDGKPVKPPAEWENSITHWKTHVRELQELGFQSLPEPIQKGFLDHVMATEMLMHEKSQSNDAYAHLVAALELYPVVYKLPPPPPPMPPPGAPQGLPPGGPPPVPNGMMPPPGPIGPPPAPQGLQGFQPPPQAAQMPDNGPPMPSGPMGPPNNPLPPGA